MKKNCFAALMLLGTAAFICGFDSAPDTKEILARQQEALSSVSSLEADVDFCADLVIDLAGAKLTALAKGTADLALQTEEPALMLEASIDLTTPLMAQEDTVEYKLYLTENESGSPEVFLFQSDAVTGEQGWSHSAADDLKTESLIPSVSALHPDRISELGISFDLDPVSVDVDGETCRRLSSVLDQEAFSSIAEEITDQMGVSSSNEISELISAVLDGLKLSLDYLISEETWLPIQLHMDLNESDMAGFEQLLHTYLESLFGTEEDFAVTITLNDVSLDLTASYNTVDKIEVPEEAKSAGSTR